MAETETKRDGIVKTVAGLLVDAETQGLNINEVCDQARELARSELKARTPLYTGHELADREQWLHAPTKSVSAANLSPGDVIRDDRGGRRFRYRKVERIVVLPSPDGRHRGAHPECGVSVYVEGQALVWARTTGDKPFVVVDA